MTTHVLLLAGINNSGPDHWQTHWQRENPSFKKLEHREWDKPSLDAWVRELDAEVATLAPHVVLVAHSLACLLVAHWAKTTKRRVAGALLVAVPDPGAAAFPPDAIGFGGPPLERLPFPTIVVSSTNDPYGSAEFMRHCADGWGSRFVSVGTLGHINAASKIGGWDAGKLLLRELMEQPTGRR